MGDTRFEKGRGNEYARPVKDPLKWSGLKISGYAEERISISGGCKLGDECVVLRGPPAGGASLGIRERLQVRELFYVLAGKQDVREVGAQRRTHWVRVAYEARCGSCSKNVTDVLGVCGGEWNCCPRVRSR